MRTKSSTQVPPLNVMAVAAGFTGLSPDTGIAVQTADGEIVAASPQAQRILGLSFDQMRGRTSQDPRWAAVDESGQPVPGTQHPAMLALRTGLPIRGVVMGVHRPGSEAPGHHVWLDVSAVPLTQCDDAIPWAVVSAFRPIAGDRLRDLQLRDSERIYRMIAEHSSDMVAWQLVADSTFLWVSPASQAVLGIGADELVGGSGVDRVHPEDRRALEGWRRAIIRDDHPPALTLRMRHADGRYRWMETTAHLLPDDGSPRQAIMTLRDVTDRVAAEHARDDARRMLELAMEHATIGVAFRAVDGTVFRVNPALCAMLGRSAAELTGRHLRDFTVGPDADDDRGLAAVAAGERSHYEVEREFRRPDGSTLWCIKTVIALPAESGEVTEVLVQLQDVTLRREAVARLEKAALTDPLTGLANRAVLEERLTHALASARLTGALVGVLFIDLDHFKHINDTLGHDVGDVLLRQVGMRLAGTVRHSDTVVRLGGDEFVVFREDVVDAGDLDDFADRVRDAFVTPFTVEGCDVLVAASVGATIGDDDTARQLLSRADDAMYRIKRSRRGDIAQ